jgi:flagellar basal-body rod protein FlgC
MGMFDGYDISGSAMSAQRTRLNVISANIANAQTTMTPDGGPYKKKVAIFEEVLHDADKYGNKDKQIQHSSVKVKDIVNTNSPPIYKYEPKHPHANKDGYVAYPNINEVEEMTDMMTATRAYQANVTVFQGLKKIDTSTIEILQ